MAKPLPDEIDTEVARLFNEAEALLDDGEDEQALARFQAAWERIPEPRGEWQRALQVLGGIADCQFFLCHYETCIRTLQGMLRSGGSPGNPWICLRLGQCHLHLGCEGEAAHWLTCAMITGGAAMFENEEEEYRDFLKERLAPPRGGWPEWW